MHQKNLALFQKKRKGVAIPGVKDKKNATEANGATPQTSESKKPASPTKKENPFLSKIVWKYRKFEPRSDTYYKYIDKVSHMHKMIDFNVIDYEATLEDM